MPVPATNVALHGERSVQHSEHHKAPFSLQIICKQDVLFIPTDREKAPPWLFVNRKGWNIYPFIHF